MAGNKPYGFWPKEEKEKFKKKVIDYWKSDTELTLRDVQARFHIVGRQIISDILQETSDPPKARRAKAGFNSKLMRNMKVPGNLDYSFKSK